MWIYSDVNKNESSIIQLDECSPQQCLIYIYNIRTFMFVPYYVESGVGASPLYRNGAATLTPERVIVLSSQSSIGPVRNSRYILRVYREVQYALKSFILTTLKLLANLCTIILALTDRTLNSLMKLSLYEANNLLTLPFIFSCSQD